MFFTALPFCWGRRVCPEGMWVCPGGGTHPIPIPPVPTGTDSKWRPKKHVRLASGRYASYWNAFLFLRNIYCTRMHSRRMRTVRCSGRRGVGSAQGVCRGGICPGGIFLGGVCLGGVFPSACWDTHPPPMNRIAGACENITLWQLRCGR